MARTERPFKTEVELCAKFLEELPEGWTSYPECCGWDILLVRKKDGLQIGIQAKLRCNVEVINQTLEEYGTWSADKRGPDCRAILVPGCEARGLGRIADYIGITIIRVAAPYPRGVYGAAFAPDLPIEARRWRDDWHEWLPLRRHELPEYVPDVAAGASAPLQLTVWKIAAIKIAVTLEQRGYVTRLDFKAHGIDHRRWMAAESGWLKNEGGRFVAGPGMPALKEQHPKVYQQIAADAEKWMPIGALPLLQGSLV